MDIYQQVTDSIVSAIENGVGDFKMPWHRGGGEIPLNIISGNNYQGINILTLWVEGQARGFGSSTWGTYRQWAEAGCQVRKGEKASTIMFYKQFTEEAKEGEDGEEKTRRIMRSYAVFNGDQVEGYSDPELLEVSEMERLEHVELAIKATGANIKSGGTKACYIPSTDTVLMPDERKFFGDDNKRTEAYYSVLWHEIGHWSGHKSRLDREMTNKFGDDKYAMEELIAELTSAYCCAQLSISPSPREDHAQYIASWLDVLKKDKKAIFYASARAQEAVNYLLH